MLTHGLTSELWFFETRAGICSTQILHDPVSGTTVASHRFRNVEPIRAAIGSREMVVYAAKQR